MRILILGGGFGGIRCALDLERKLRGQAEITLIDRKSYHLFIPKIYEIASAYGFKEDPFSLRLKKTISIPYSDIFAGKEVNFVQGEISGVDLSKQQVTTKGNAVIDYDYLVIALGSEVADFGISGVTEYAYKFKKLEDALLVNKKINFFIKKIADGKKETPLRFIIGGGGFTGIELAAEIACCTKVMARACNIKEKCWRINLIEAGTKILPMISDKERETIVKRLTKLGVVIMENSAIEEVRASFIKLKNGQKLEGDMIIWTAGIKVNSFLKSISGLPLTNEGKIIVGENLLVQGFSNIFGVGDNIEFVDPNVGKPVPGMAYVAIDQGKIAAKNIINTISDKKLKNYNPFYSVWIIPMGGRFALAHLWNNLIIKGFWGWVIRELVDFKYMISILSFNKAVKVIFEQVTVLTKND